MDGDGSSNNPYVITTCDELQHFVDVAGKTVAGSDGRPNIHARSDDAHFYFILGNDIDCSGYNFQPIREGFWGILDGRGHTISNLHVGQDNWGNSYFLYALTWGGVIKNIVFDGFEADGGGDYSDTAFIDLMTNGSEVFNLKFINIHLKKGEKGLVAMVAFDGVHSDSSKTTKIHHIYMQGVFDDVSTGGGITPQAYVMYNEHTPQDKPLIEIECCDIDLHLASADDFGGISDLVDTSYWED